MSERKVPAIIQPILDSGMLEAGEAMTLRRWFYGDGMLHQEDAESLFRVNARLAGRFVEFNALFVGALSDFIVYQMLPTGRVSAEQADWLMGEMGGAGAMVETTNELELLVRILEEAHEIPANLAAFALQQVKHAAITGEGPAARGRPHFSRTVDAADVDLVSRILEGARGGAGGVVSRAEADVLFDIADACNGGRNDEAWDHLFIRAIANHLIGTAVPGGPAGSGEGPDATHAEGRSRRIDEAGAAWLAGRIRRDGQISEAERALLKFVDPAGGVDPVAVTAIARMA